MSDTLTREQEIASSRFYAERYEVIFEQYYVVPHAPKLWDNDTSRCCRFCGLDESKKVPFEQVAHAVPEFLGNKTILSLNECDNCNKKLADLYENDLSKWSHFARSLSKLKGKGGAPTFKNPRKSMRVETKNDQLAFHFFDPALTSEVMQLDEPFQFTLPADATSPPHTPLRAAAALVKIACSICPKEHLVECQPAIDWLMERREFRFVNFPVLYVSTPGPPEAFQNKAVLLRRKGDTPEPLLCCVVHFANHRLQVFVPGCPADITTHRTKDPVMIPPWVDRSVETNPPWPFGESSYTPLDWSSGEVEKNSPSVVFTVREAWRVNGPTKTG